MKKDKSTKLIVVLGMHRSGTSTITRGLKAIGVDLGNQFWPSIITDNPKGYWEDKDVNILNIELLNHIGLDWHSLDPIPTSKLEEDNITTFRLRAIQILQAKITNTLVYAIKDPRIARLLPFWKSVFDYLELDVSYVIVVRNPISVAHSLSVRNAFTSERSYFLWFNHMVPAITDTMSTRRIVVNYDRVMDDPMAQLKRIASAFELPWDNSSFQVSEYIQEFLDQRLRHTRFQVKDLHLDNAVPQELIRIYEYLEKMADDVIATNAPDVCDFFLEMKQKLEMISAQHCTIEYVRQVVQRDIALAERDIAFAERDRALNERETAMAIIEIMRNSISWRVTMPLRYLAKLLRDKLPKGVIQKKHL